MIKLIVTDLDGTLLDTNHQLPTDFWEVEKQLFDTNIIFAIATGRQFYNVINLFDKIKDRTLFLAENGTYGYYKGDEIFVNPLPKQDAIRFIEIGREIPSSNVIFCGKNSAYVENENVQFLTEVRKYYEKLQIVSDLTLVDDEVLKITICDFGDVPTNSYSFFKEFEKDFKVAISGAIWLDITNFTANKGVAISKIQQEFCILKSETMVFGDFLNDLEMMKTAHYSYAMKNAHSQIIECSNFCTNFDNNNGGVTDIIKQIVFQKTNI